MRRAWIMTLFFLLTVPVAQAQTVAWEIVLYEDETDSLHFVTPQGIRQTIPLPVFQGSAALRRFIPQQISPDYRYAAGLVQEVVADESAYPRHYPAITNLVEHHCCLLLNVPMTSTEEFFIQFSNFTADSQRIILATNNFSFDNNTGAASGGGILSLIEVASGTVLRQVETKDYFAVPAFYRPDGLRFLTAPLGGSEWLPEGFYSIWNTDTGAILESASEIALFRGDVLPTTGEIVNAAYNEDFPVDEVGMFYPGNVIEYYPAGQLPFDKQFNPKPGTVVFYTPQDLNHSVSWVMDGNAFLVHNGVWSPTDMITVVLRGGQQETLNTPGQRYLAATPNGWLMYDTAMRLFQYARSGDGLAINQLAQFTPPSNEFGLHLIPLNTLPIGTNVAAGGFPSVVHAEIQAASNAPACPGTQPSRLSVGERGWVLPGTPNNLRDAPTTRGSKIGEIPGSIVFTVLEGPVCADNYAWWRVRDMMGQEGWTAEGNADEYWIAPLR